MDLQFTELSISHTGEIPSMKILETELSYVVHAWSSGAFLDLTGIVLPLEQLRLHGHPTPVQRTHSDHPQMSVLDRDKRPAYRALILESLRTL